MTLQLLSTMKSLRNEIKMLSESVEGLQNSIVGLQGCKTQPIKKKRIPAVCQDMKSIYITCYRRSVTKLIFHSQGILGEKRETVFPLARLPLELRTMIWKTAAPGGRLFEPEARFPSSEPNLQGVNQFSIGEITVSRRPKPPAIRAVCQESRRVSDDIRLLD